MSCRSISSGFDAEREITFDSYRRSLIATRVGPSNGGFETTSVAVAKDRPVASMGLRRESKHKAIYERMVVCLQQYTRNRVPYDFPWHGIR